MLLCYLSAVFGLIFGVVASSAILAVHHHRPRRRRLRHRQREALGLRARGRRGVLHVLMYLLIYRSSIITNVGLLISFVFDVALVLLLVHPMSRDYQRIWFK